MLGSARRIGLLHTKTLSETDNTSFLLYLGGVVQGVIFLAVVTAYGRSHVVTGVHIGHDAVLRVVGVAIHLLLIVKSVAAYVSTIAITSYGAIVIDYNDWCIFRTGGFSTSSEWSHLKKCFICFLVQARTRADLHLNYAQCTVDDVVILPSHVFKVGWCVRPHQLVQVEGVETTAPLGLRPRRAITSTKRKGGYMRPRRGRRGEVGEEG